MISHSQPAFRNIERIRPLRLVINHKQFACISELELVLACQRREPGAIEILLKRNEHIITGIMHRLAPEVGDTSDIRQEVSIKIWRSISLLKDPASFKRWLRTIVTNSLYDLFRKRRQFQCVSLDEPSSCSEEYALRGTRDIKDSSPQPDEMALRKELSVVLTDALCAIPKQFKTAIVLREVEGLSYEDIALLTRSELGTVKSRISRARVKVQKKLVAYCKSSHSDI